jgi:RHS repeat-associated protein
MNRLSIRSLLFLLLSLSVYGCAGSGSAPVTVLPPVANPGGPYTGNVGQAISFSGSQSTAPSGETITSYAWVFGDGATGTGVSPTHTYTTAGTFQVSLTVTDTTDGTNSLSTTAMAFALPGANAGGPYTGNVGQAISFNGSGSTTANGDAITAYAWNFGDNSTGTGATPTHAYTAAGPYAVSLTVTDTTGGTNSLSTTATAYALPTATPGGPYTGNVNQAISFNGSGSTTANGDAITAYAWSFGDGSTGTGATPTHAYTAAGPYTVSLTVTDTTGGTNSLSTTATAYALPVAMAGGSYRGTAGQAVAFNGSGSTSPVGDALTIYTWNFGDSSTGTGASPSHVYPSTGIYNVTLTVTDATGGTNFTTTLATITGQSAPPPMITNFGPVSGPVGTLVTITGANFTGNGSSAPAVTLASQGGGISAPISSFTATSVSFVIPDGGTTGPITVAVGTQNVASASPLTVTTASNFTVVVSGTGNLIQGQSTTYAVTINSSNGFSGLASLAVMGLPAGVTASFLPTAATAGQTALMTLTAPANQASSTSTLSVSGTATISGQTVTKSAPAPLQVTAVSTSFIGRTVVDDSTETSIAGVTVSFLGKDSTGRITNCSGQTTSDASGNFSLTNLPAACIGPQLISYNGLTATSPAGTYAGVNLSYTLTSGQVTTSPVLIHLPRIDNAETVQIQQNAPSNQVFTFGTIPNVVVTVYAGTTFSLDDGSQPNPFPLVAIDIPVDRLPDQMATTGMLTPFIVAFQPANAFASQPVAVDFPNSFNLAPGTAATFVTLDPTRGFMVPYGTGAVSSDGTKFLADADPANPGHRYGLVHFDWHGPMGPGPNGKNPSPDPHGPHGGDPVDPASGLLVVGQTDIALSSPRGRISLERVYRPGSSASVGVVCVLDCVVAPFGNGTNHNYGYLLDTNCFIKSACNYLTLDAPDGNQYHFIQNGNSFIDAYDQTMLGAVITGPPTANAALGGGGYSLRWKNGAVYQFQSASQLGSSGILLQFLTSITDSNGNVVTLVRGNSSQPDQITQIVDPVGRSLTLTYDSANRITVVTDPIGRTVQYTYNSQGTLATVQDAGGGLTKYAYDAQNEMLSITDPRGVVYLQNIYDGNGRLIQQVDAAGGTTSFGYTLLDTATGTISIVGATAPVLQSTVTDPLGNQTTYRFDSKGYVLQATDALGQSRTFIRDPDTNLLLGLQGTGTCGACGDTTLGDVSFAYDSAGNLLSETNAAGQSVHFTYEPTFNNMTSFTDEDGNTWKFGYGNSGNLQSFTDANGNVSAFTYNGTGELTQYTDAAGKTTTFSYDGAGDMISAQDAAGNVRHAVYDAASRQVLQTDALGNQTSYSYDSLNRLTSLTDALGNKIQATYDPFGNVLSATDPRGNTTNYTYDAALRPVSRTDALGRTTKLGYDAAGNLNQFTDSLGRTTTFGFDALNRVITANYPDATVTPTYDAHGRAAQVVDSQSGTFGLAYDTVGHVISQLSPFGTINFTRDPAGRITARTVVGQPEEDLTYDGNGNLTHISSGDAGVNLQYDARNLRTAITRSNGVSTSLGYDALGRLLSRNDSLGAAVLNAQNYSYDANGRRLNYQTVIGQPLVTAAASGQYDASNQIQQFAGQIYTYDANGNALSSTGASGATQYAWDARGRLQSVTTPTGEKVGFTYDYEGYLVQMQSSTGRTTSFVLDNLTNFAAENDNAGNSFSFLTGNGFDAQFGYLDANGQPHFALQGNLGNVVASTSSNGSIEGTAFFEPYGQTTTSGASFPLAFAGHLQPVSNLYYYRARFYDPISSRFLSEDPLGLLGGNLYRFELNDPTNQVDPLGLLTPADTLLAAGVGAVIGVGGRVLGDLLKGEISSPEDYAGAAIGGAVTGALLSFGVPPVFAGASGGYFGYAGRQALTGCNFTLGGAAAATAFGAANGLAVANTPEALTEALPEFTPTSHLNGTWMRYTVAPHFANAAREQVGEETLGAAVEGGLSDLEPESSGGQPASSGGTCKPKKE